MKPFLWMKSFLQYELIQPSINLSALLVVAVTPLSTKNSNNWLQSCHLVEFWFKVAFGRYWHWQRRITFLVMSGGFLLGSRVWELAYFLTYCSALPYLSDPYPIIIRFLSSPFPGLVLSLSGPYPILIRSLSNPYPVHILFYLALIHALSGPILYFSGPYPLLIRSLSYPYPVLILSLSGPYPIVIRTLS